MPIEYIIDTRTVNGNAQAHADAVKKTLQDFWKQTDIKITLVNYDVLNKVLTDYDNNGYRMRLINQIADTVLTNLNKNQSGHPH